jgi:hypothetical protein
LIHTELLKVAMNQHQVRVSGQIVEVIIQNVVLFSCRLPSFPYKLLERNYQHK